MNLLWSNIFRRKAEEESLAYFLRKNPIFSELGERDFRFLESFVHPRRYAPQEIIFEEGDTGSGMYLIRSGKVKIYARDTDGSEEELALLEPGDFFGEITLTAPTTRTASARTTESSELIGLFRADLLGASEKHPALANKILFGLARVMSERLQAMGTESRHLKKELSALQALQEEKTAG